MNRDIDFLGRKKKSQLAPEPFIENYGPLCFGTYIVKKRHFGKAGVELESWLVCCR